EVNPDKNFFNLLAPSLANEEVEFTVDVDGFELTEITSVDVELVYTEKGAIFDPFREEFVDSTYAPVILENLTSFPATVTITGQEVADALNIPVDSLEVGDAFQVTLPIHTADGRRLTVALNSDLCNEPAQPSFGGCGVAWSVACPSEIPTGDWETAVSPDPGACNLFQSAGFTPTLTDLGAGQYQLSNFDYGYFGNCCGNIRAIFNDVCNTITLTGTTEFGVAWRGEGQFIPDGGPAGKGQIILDCHFDATFGGPSATDSIVLNKL
ncbi:MAG: hypothetical protein R3345_04405, partial [Fulvivirga sp.]|nr:hypothetical protein [Fulvivirga sp.]